MLQRMTAGLSWVLVGVLGSGTAAAQGTPPLMDALFVDHAVLQRDRPIDVFGHAGPARKSR